MATDTCLSMDARTNDASARWRAALLVHAMAILSILAMPTVSHRSLFGVSEAFYESRHQPLFSTVLALWNVDVALPVLAGVGFAVAVSHYNKRETYQSYVFLGFGALIALGTALTLRDYAEHAVTTKAAFSNFVHYVVNVLLPVFALTEIGAAVLRKWGSPDAPQLVWLWKLLAGVTMLITLLRFDISMQANGLL